MASLESLIAAPVDFRATDSQVNLAATATQAAPGAGFRLVVTGFSISANGPPAAGVLCQIRKNAGATEVRRFQIPASAFAPIIVEFKHAHQLEENVSADITLPALGAGITGTVELLGLIKPI